MINPGVHFFQMTVYAVEMGQLSQGPLQVVFGILDFVVCISVEVIGQKTDGLHIG